MSSERRQARNGYLKFLGILILISGGLVSVGYIPTAKTGGESALVAMVAAAALALAGSAAGGAAIAAASAGAIAPGPGPTLLAMGLRLGLVLAGTVLLIVARIVEPRAFLLWIALAYLLLLPVDIRYALTAPQPPTAPSS